MDHVTNIGFHNAAGGTIYQLSKCKRTDTSAKRKDEIMRTTSSALPRGNTGSGLGLRHVSHLHAVWRSRRALASLTDAQLDDIGLSRQQAEGEANRAPWDAPATWCRS
jgi:uncharacterized protein YjiS (DUF1127 family)